MLLELFPTLVFSILCSVLRNSSIQADGSNLLIHKIEVLYNYLGVFV